MEPTNDGERHEGPQAVRAAGPDAPMEAPRAAEEDGLIHPQRLLRIASVTHEVLEEVRRMRPERGAVAHIRRLHGRILDELRHALPLDLYEELHDLTPEIVEGSLEELAVAHAEILGWLEGLFQGTRLALQLEAARAFREQMRRSELPPGAAEKEEHEPREARYL
jgi:hypothetical protein